MVSHCFGILHWHATDSLYARLQHSKSFHKKVLPVLYKTEWSLSHICQLISCDHMKWYHIALAYVIGMLRTLSMRDYNTPSHSLKKFCLYTLRHRMGLEPYLPTHKL